MSFLLNALGNSGVQLLGRAGGWLGSRAVPLASRLAGWIGNTFGGGGTTGSMLGQSVTDYLVGKAIDTTYDAAHRFAGSDFVKKKMPIVSSYIQDGATQFRDRMREGYAGMLGTGGGGGGGGNATIKEPLLGGIEKTAMQ